MGVELSALMTGGGSLAGRMRIAAIGVGTGRAQQRTADQRQGGGDAAPADRRSAHRRTLPRPPAAAERRPRSIARPRTQRLRQPARGAACAGSFGIILHRGAGPVRLPAHRSDEDRHKQGPPGPARLLARHRQQPSHGRHSCHQAPTARHSGSPLPTGRKVIVGRRNRIPSRGTRRRIFAERRIAVAALAARLEIIAPVGRRAERRRPFRRRGAAPNSLAAAGRGRHLARRISWRQIALRHTLAGQQIAWRRDRVAASRVRSRAEDHAAADRAAAVARLRRARRTFARVRRTDRSVRSDGQARPADRCYWKNRSSATARPPRGTDHWNGSIDTYSRPPYTCRFRFWRRTRSALDGSNRSVPHAGSTERDQRISSGASTPRIHSPDARTVTTPCTRARRATVICGSFAIMKRK